MLCDWEIRESGRDGAPLSSAACVGGGERRKEEERGGIHASIFRVCADSLLLSLEERERERAPSPPPDDKSTGSTPQRACLSHVTRSRLAAAVCEDPLVFRQGTCERRHVETKSGDKKASSVAKKKKKKKNCFFLLLPNYFHEIANLKSRSLLSRVALCSARKQES